MDFLGRIICTGCLLAPIPAWCGWGSLSESRVKYPALFVPNAVIELTVDGVDGYAYAGSVRQSFAGNAVQPDTALYRRAALVAKRNLLHYLQGKDESLVVEMSGSVMVYEYADGAMRTVVCFVPKNKVSVRAKPAEEEKPSQAVETPPAVEQATQKPVAEGPKPALEAATVDRYLKEVEARPSSELWSQIALIYINDGLMDKASVAYSNLVEVVVTNANVEDAADWILEAARFEDGRKNTEVALRYYRLVKSTADMKSAGASRAVSFANGRIADLLLK